MDDEPTHEIKYEKLNANNSYFTNKGYEEL